MVGGFHQTDARQLPCQTFGMTALFCEPVEQLECLLGIGRRGLACGFDVSQFGGDSIDFLRGVETFFIDSQIELPADTGDGKQPSFRGRRCLFHQSGAGQFDCFRLGTLFGEQLKLNQKGFFLTGNLPLNVSDEFEQFIRLTGIPGFDAGGPGAGKTDDHRRVMRISAGCLHCESIRLRVLSPLYQAIHKPHGRHRPVGILNRGAKPGLCRLIHLAHPEAGLTQKVAQIGIVRFNAEGLLAGFHE